MALSMLCEGHALTNTDDLSNTAGLDRKSAPQLFSLQLRIAMENPYCNSKLSKSLGRAVPSCVLVGHSLENDLKAMRVFHAKVRSTACILIIDNPHRSAVQEGLAH